MNTIQVTSNKIKAYLLEHGYHTTYLKGTNKGFYNPRNRQTLLVPNSNDSLTKIQVLELFQNSKAIDMPAELEWYRFQIFLFNQKQ